MDWAASLLGGLGLFFLGVKALSAQLVALAGLRLHGPWRRARRARSRRCCSACCWAA